MLQCFLVKAFLFLKMSKRKSKPQKSVPSEARRHISEKCKKCAMLTADQAKELHGEEGDGCWKPEVCHSKRSYIRHRDRRNQTRNRKRQAGLVEYIAIPVDEFEEIVSAVLVVYRPPGAESPVHAIGASVWKGQKKCAEVEAIHCIGWTPTQVIVYVKKILFALGASYGIKKFASIERVDPWRCTICPCPHHP